MTLWTKWRPAPTRSITTLKFNVPDQSDFFVKQLLELMQLFFCLLVVNTLTFKLRFKAAILRLENFYLTFCLCQSIISAM